MDALSLYAKAMLSHGHGHLWGILVMETIPSVPKEMETET